MPPTPPDGEPRKIPTVTDLTRDIKAALLSRFAKVEVIGEISGLKRAGSGHVYFNLKDAGALINCVLWRSSAERLRFKPEDGQEVIVTGKLDVYEPRGQYNLVASAIQVAGLGTLQQQFEKLKAKLQAEGLFDADRKRPLPPMPRMVGVVTSPTGAAFHDIRTTLMRRFPHVTLILYPAKVQGEGAKDEVAAGIRYFNQRYAGEMDVMIVGRGGGSLEDLWAFNEEVVARTIFTSRIPVVSAVGHEVDFTIADFVADLRAATPTAAAELVVPDIREIEAGLTRHRSRLMNALRGVAQQARARVDGIRGSYGFAGMADRVRNAARELDDMAAGLHDGLRERVRGEREKLGLLAARLDELSPLKILGRGYSVTMGPDGKSLRHAGAVSAGDEILTRLADGRVRSIVKEASS